MFVSKKYNTIRDKIIYYTLNNTDFQNKSTKLLFKTFLYFPSTISKIDKQLVLWLKRFKPSITYDYIHHAPSALSLHNIQSIKKVLVFFTSL